MKKLLILFVLCGVSLAQATSHVYVKIVDSGLLSSQTITVTDRITKDGATVFTHTGTYTLGPSETVAQFKTRVITFEKSILDAQIDTMKSQDATESTNTDVSAQLVGITQ